MGEISKAWQVLIDHSIASVSSFLENGKDAP